VSEIIVVTGPMFSGKSTYLFNQVEKFGIPIYRFTLDGSRVNAKELLNHDNDMVKGRNITSFLQISRDKKKICIDEVQFAPVEMAQEFMDVCFDEGIDLYVGCLDMDWRRNPFETSGAFMCRATQVIKKMSRCGFCGADARFSAKVSGNMAKRFEESSGDKYVPACLSCYREHTVR
jgi:thymidine kinase